jgi:hypothetical protein
MGADHCTITALQFQISNFMGEHRLLGLEFCLIMAENLSQDIFGVEADGDREGRGFKKKERLQSFCCSHLAAYIYFPLA